MIKKANNKELVPERQQRIHELIRTKRVVRVDEVCNALNVSAATVRRDLEALEKQGRVRRVHGGALSTETRLDEPFFDDKTEIAAGEKQRIALGARALLREREELLATMEKAEAAEQLEAAQAQLAEARSEVRFWTEI